jgi:hypothetical protein
MATDKNKDAEENTSAEFDPKKDESSTEGKLPTMNPELERYLHAVEQLAIEESDHVFKNSSHDHASIVMATMLKHSKKFFYIYDCDLSGDIADRYPGFYKELENFVVRGEILKIVVEDDNQRSTKIFHFLEGLHRQFPTKVILKKSVPTFTDRINEVRNKRLRFAVGDSVSFRLEEIDSPKDEANRKAFCCFRDINTASDLRTAFEDRFQDCELVL